MSKFQVGDKVVRYAVDAGRVMKGKPYLVVSDVQKSYIALEGLHSGCGWYEEYFELYQEPAQIAFNPKPGDTIVTKGEGTWVCSTVQEINNLKGISFHTSDPIVGYQRNTAGCIQHQDWDEFGSTSVFDTELQIKEIIPASSNNSAGIPQQPQDLSFQVKALELENQMLRMLLRREGVEV